MHEAASAAVERPIVKVGNAFLAAKAAGDVAVFASAVADSVPVSVGLMAACLEGGLRTKLVAQVAVEILDADMAVPMSFRDGSLHELVKRLQEPGHL